MNPLSETTCVMCHAPRNSSQFSVTADYNSDSFDDFLQDDLEATTSFAAQTVKPKEAPKIVRDISASEDETPSEEDIPDKKEPALVSSVKVSPVILKKPVLKPLSMKLHEEKKGGKDDVVIKKPVSVKSAVNPRAGKSASIQVVSKPATSRKEVDVFAELGMGAESCFAVVVNRRVKKTTRISVPAVQKVEVKQVAVSDDSVETS